MAPEFILMTFVGKLLFEKAYSTQLSQKSLKFELASNTNSEIIIRDRSARHLIASSNFQITMEKSFPNGKNQRNAFRCFIYVSKNNFSSDASNINESVRNCCVKSLSAFASILSKSTSGKFGLFWCLSGDIFAFS